MNHLQKTDEELVMLSLARDDAAFETLVRRWERAVSGAAFYVTRNRCLAEDAAEDAFVSAWMKLDTLHDPSKFGGWVCRIARNRAKSIMTHEREHLSFELIENLECDESDTTRIPDELLVLCDMSMSLNECVDSLPEKVRRVIRLHYYEGYSIAEIAAMQSVPIGTVKWQLSDGRRRLRKEFGIMEEKPDEKLVARIMARVEELKLWHIKNDKSGLIKEYEPLLADIESMPESREKYHALADVLKIGLWWLPGNRNEELLERIRGAALKSGNEEALKAVLVHDFQKISGRDRIEYMLNTQIPQLEAAGYKSALGYIWFWLGYEYYSAGEPEKGEAAYSRALGLLEISDLYYANTLSALEVERLTVGLENMKFHASAIAEEYRYIEGKPRFWSQPGYGRGWMSQDIKPDYVFCMAAQCDHIFFDESLKPGESITGSDGRTLTFAAIEDVSTPAGDFAGCRKWVTAAGERIISVWYKRGVGIVRERFDRSGQIDEQLLKSYSVEGDGLLPMKTGNRWEYERSLGAGLEYRNRVEIIYADSQRVIASAHCLTRRAFYDEESWQDMTLAARSEYFKLDGGNERLVDVSHYLVRMEALAGTSLQRAHTAAACSAMRRIMACSADLNPDRKARGRWDFFECLDVSRSEGSVGLSSDRKYSFEWKEMDGMRNDCEGYSLLYNDVYGILCDNVGCVWSDEWEIGYEGEYSEKFRDETRIGRYKVLDAGRVETAAGSFDGCIRLDVTCEGYSGGWWYRGVRKEYYFAPGVGIIRTVNHYNDDMLPAVFELTAYDGSGEGFFPLEDGFMRRYDCIGLTGGYEASAVYTCARENGNFRIFADRAGTERIGC